MSKPKPSTYRVRLRQYHAEGSGKQWLECWLIELPENGSECRLHGTLLPEDGERLAAWFMSLGVEVVRDMDSPLPVASDSPGNPYADGGLFAAVDQPE